MSRTLSSTQRRLTRRAQDWQPGYSQLTKADRTEARTKAKAWLNVILSKDQLDSLEAEAVLTVYAWMVRVGRFDA